MEIKLRATLSAYSKVDVVKQNATGLPNTAGADGAMLGVNSEEEYELVQPITKEDIDSLFQDVS